MHFENFHSFRKKIIITQPKEIAQRQVTVSISCHMILFLRILCVNTPHCLNPDHGMMDARNSKPHNGLSYGWVNNSHLEKSALPSGG